jgi:hypothetical protein
MTFSLPSFHVPATPPFGFSLTRVAGHTIGGRPIRIGIYGKRDEALTKTGESYAPGYVDLRASVGLRKIGDVWRNIEGAEGCRLDAAHRFWQYTYILTEYEALAGKKRDVVWVKFLKLNGSGFKLLKLLVHAAAKNVF